MLFSLVFSHYSKILIHHLQRRNCNVPKAHFSRNGCKTCNIEYLRVELSFTWSIPIIQLLKAQVTILIYIRGMKNSNYTFCVCAIFSIVVFKVCWCEFYYLYGMTTTMQFDTWKNFFIVSGHGWLHVSTYFHIMGALMSIDRKDK